MSDMTKDVFAEQGFGKVALKKLSPVSENFRFYAAGWLDDERTVMRVTGAEFRIAKSGPNKGKLSVLLPGTKRNVCVTAEEMNNCQA